MAHHILSFAFSVLPHARWDLRFAGFLALGFLLSLVLGLFLKSHQLGAIIGRALAFGGILLAVSTYLPTNVISLVRATMADASVEKSAAEPLPAVPNLADPLDPSYRPAINTDPGSYPANVWVSDSMQKVSKDAATPGRLHWAVLSAAKNEFADFQVHIQAGANPISLNVAVSDLVNARTGTRISHESNIVVYREAYMNITTRSNANGSLGQIPDVLIPAVDPYYRQARNAFPVQVLARQNQSAWIDVLVPLNAPSGYYSGTASVFDGDKTIAAVPVLLSVWNFTLPSTSTLKSAFRITGYGLCDQAYGNEMNCGAYPRANGNWISGIDLSHIDQAVMFLDHRVSLSNLVFFTPYDNNWTSFNRLYGPLLNGTRANTSTMLAGAQLTTIEFDNGGNSTRQQWVTNFQAQGWMPRLYDYACDEPPENCDWKDIAPRASADRSVNPPIKTMVTTSLSRATAQNVLSSIDILSPVVDQLDGLNTANQRSAYDAWLATPGHRLWWYQSCEEASTCDNGKPGDARQTYANYMIDAAPVRNRVFQWLAYLNRIETELYYDSDYCWSTPCGYPTRSMDPWNNVYIFGGNGDGTLEYPGTPAKIGGTAPIPLPSVRLELIRDGMQDYEYLAALEKAGYGNFARATARSFITNPYSFKNEPEALMNARQQLGAKLHLLSFSVPVSFDSASGSPTSKPVAP